MDAAFLDAFGLDPDVLHLNHGAFGVAPVTVRRAAADWRERAERNPHRFNRVSESERAAKVRRELPADWDNVSVAAWAGMTAAFCREHGASVIIRGVRNRSDPHYEYQLAATNEALGITTLLLPARPELMAMSSTVMRGLGGREQKGCQP